MAGESGVCIERVGEVTVTGAMDVKGRIVRSDARWVIVGPCDESPPPRVSARKGATKYPFGELETGYALHVHERTISAVRDAVRRYVLLHPGEQFQTWRGSAGAVIVKRVK